MLWGAALLTPELVARIAKLWGAEWQKSLQPVAQEIAEAFLRLHSI